MRKTDGEINEQDKKQKATFQKSLNPRGAFLLGVPLNSLL